MQGHTVRELEPRLTLAHLMPEPVPHLVSLPTRNPSPQLLLSRDDCWTRQWLPFITMS